MLDMQLERMSTMIDSSVRNKGSILGGCEGALVAVCATKF